LLNRNEIVAPNHLSSSRTPLTLVDKLDQHESIVKKPQPTNVFLRNVFGNNPRRADFGEANLDMPTFLRRNAE
jgi:hypothetical protein